MKKFGKYRIINYICKARKMANVVKAKFHVDIALGEVSSYLIDAGEEDLANHLDVVDIYPLENIK